MNLEAFIALDVCGNTKSEPFPIVRESGTNPAESIRIDFYLNARNDGGVKSVLEIVKAVNEHAALEAVAEAANQVQHFILYVKLGKATQQELDDACDKQDNALALANIAAIRNTQ